MCVGLFVCACEHGQECFALYACVYVFVCVLAGVCVWVGGCVGGWLCVCTCVCACVRGNECGYMSIFKKCSFFVNKKK